MSSFKIAQIVKKPDMPVLGPTMKKFLLAGVTALTLVSGAAGAADVATRAPNYYAQVAAYNWTGWYGGINAGGFWGHSKADVTQAGDTAAGFGVGGCPTLLSCAFSQTNSPEGFLGGVQAGYNYQVGAFVYGIEADFDWRHSQKSSTPMVFEAFGDNDVSTTKQNWFGTLRARLGFIPADRWLAFVSGGLAYGSLQHTLTQQWCFLTAAPPFCMPSRAISNSVIKVGWTIGTGAQYAINNNWLLGAEYLYISLGDDTVTAPTTGLITPPVGAAFHYTAFTATFHDYSHVVRVRLDYKFQ